MFVSYKYWHICWLFKWQLVLGKQQVNEEIKLQMRGVCIKV